MAVFRRRETPAPARRLRAVPDVPNTALTAGAGAHARAVNYNSPRPITAAARQVNLKREGDVEQLAKRLRAADKWQTEAWEYYDLIGEVKFAFTVVANILSRVQLYAGHAHTPGRVPVEADPNSTGGQAAISALAKLNSVYGGQPGLMRDAALNFLVAGECYLVQVPAVPGDPDRAVESWDIKSVDEVVVDTNRSIRLRSQRHQTANEYSRPLPSSAYVGRLWRPHPRFSEDADSSMLALRELCAELLLINRSYRATERSRLNAGALYLPDGLSVSSTSDAYEDTDSDQDLTGVDPSLFAGGDNPDDEDEFEEALVDAMTTPIADEASASSVVPLIIRGPAELGDKIKLIKFERSYDEALTARADRVLDRIMQGIDVPKDVVQGLANVKYANAVQISDDLYKAHIEPLALLICDCLTTAFLRPAMIALGVDPDEVDEYCVWYDPSEVTTRPNKSDDADNGHDRNLLSGSAWRKAHGFTDEDAPTATELALNMLNEKASLTPELTEALLTVIAPDVMAKVREASQASNPAPLPPEVANALTDQPQPGQGDSPAPDLAEPNPAAAPAGTPTAAPANDQLPSTISPDQLA